MEKTGVIGQILMKTIELLEQLGLECSTAILIVILLLASFLGYLIVQMVRIIVEMQMEKERYRIFGDTDCGLCYDRTSGKIVATVSAQKYRQEVKPHLMALKKRYNKIYGKKNFDIIFDSDLDCFKVTTPNEEFYVELKKLNREPNY